MATTNVSNYPGNYVIRAVNGFVEVIALDKITLTAPSIVASNDLLVKGNTQLGDGTDALSSGDSIDPRAQFIDSLIPQTADVYNLGDELKTWKQLNVENLVVWKDAGDDIASSLNGVQDAEYKNIIHNLDNPGNPYTGFVGTPGYDEFGRQYAPEIHGVFGSTAQRQRAALYVAGGVGIEKDLNVGGFIYGRVETAVTATFGTFTATNADIEFNLGFVLQEQVGEEDFESFTYIDSTGTIAGLTYNPFLGRITTDRVLIGADDTSTGTSSGALIVQGGAGIARDVYIGGDLTVTNVLPQADATGTIGTTDTQWAEAYVHDIYTRVIASTTGTVQINPAAGVTEVVGDIRVRGQNPIGTAPVVTNTLYVTMDGDDTNDGRAMDASRACRTIGGAVNSPYYQPGTQILVSAGFYLEDNPVRMKPYTSIRGSDIRTTFIEPINKTQDLFHVDSGCYINYVTFLNGRSGLLQGAYDPKYNRGAYATAFPPQEGDERIDLYHSPYIQNCTNQSGPWLFDGTMFVPNQTVQVPASVGVGSWLANTASIIVDISTGTVERGMYVNAGQQNPGFFDARTLILANKPFIQEQVIAYVDQTFNTGTFVYDDIKCARDTGLIVDSIAQDMLANSTSESIFAGLQYWRQTDYVDAINSQITATIATIEFVRDLAVSVATDASSATEGGIVTDRFNNILEILNTSTETLATGEFSQWVTDSIISNSTATTDAGFNAAFDAVLAAKATITDQAIDNLNLTIVDLVYDETKCRRDIGYMLDSVAYDLLHSGNKQSIKSGVYYFGYTGDTTEIPNEIPQTTAAYNFIKSLLPSIIKAQPVALTYSSTLQDITTYLPGTDTEVAILSDKIDIITNIIRNGPSAVTARIPISTTVNQSSNIDNAYKQLSANRDFIKDEVIAYLDTFGTFNYSKEKCFRDVGIILENISYDAAFGGNEKSVQSGLSYYNGVVSLIAGQEVQTIAAIDYINDLVQQVIVNQECVDLYSTGLSTTATYSQIINTAITGGAVASRSLSDLFNIVTTIINSGVDAAPEIYFGTNADAAYVSAEVLMQANRAFIQQDTINYINNLVLSFPYSEIKCRRDTGLIVDSIAFDMLYPTDGYSQSTFAGLQYWNRDEYVGDIQAQLAPTVEAVKYLKDLAIKVVQNITPDDDLVVRYQSTVTQVVNLEPATVVESNIIKTNFEVILDILSGNSLGWTDKIVSNAAATDLPAFLNAYDLLLANKDYMAHEVTAYVDATNAGFVYDASKCRRDVGHMVDAVAFDLIHSGNRQSVQTGLYYYGFDDSTITIRNQEIQTNAAFNYLADLTELVVTNQPVAALQTRVNQFLSDTPATTYEADVLRTAISTITNIITNGPSVDYSATAIAMTATSTASTYIAFDLLNANKEFLVEEVIAYIDKTYNPNSFNYDEALCYRDIGLIVDAVSQDVLLGGNAKSIEAGLAYWNFGVSHVTGQETTTTLAFNHARDISLQIIANQPVTPQTGTVISQVINPFFQYGADYMPQEAVGRNFDIITTIVNRGPLYAPPKYLGGGLFALTGINGSDVLTAPQVTSISTISEGRYLIGLTTATIGFGTDATLYFGDVLTVPLRDFEVEAQSLEFTGSTSTWNQRKTDPIGSMGGALIDGAVISERSPIQSFVFDAYTQLTQGGRGVRITNDGYAQLVSVFTVFSSVGVQVDNGGIASIVNSNANFGDLCLVAKGYGDRKFSGQLYNPPFRSYPESPDLPGSDYFDQYYPEGFWPNNAQVAVYLPDQDNRPHISLVMEIVPPVNYINEQGFSGFLNASPTTSTLSTGTIVLNDIDTTNVYIGNTVIVRDQFGNTTSTVVDSEGQWVPYITPGTVVTDVGFNSITLSNAVAAGGGELTNPNFFDFYFCGSAYYTVLTSELLENPKYNDRSELIPLGINILSTASTGGDVSQIPAHIEAMQYLNSLTTAVINNTTVVSLQTGTTTSTQTILPLVRNGGDAQTFIDLRFNEIVDIINAPDLTAAERVIKPSLRTTSGPTVQGAGSAIILISQNIEFLADEVTAFVNDTFVIPPFTYDADQCRRDVKTILQRLIYDIETGGRYNSVMCGLAYWNRPGTYHRVSLGENITRTDLFPHNSTVNFYQRSYISASGYVFEYVGAGTNYGALPQRGRADPIQARETVQLDSGKVFFTSTDQNGDFRIGPGLVISQATGVLSGRTFTRSLFANLTPFILAIESGS